VSIVTIRGSLEHHITSGSDSYEAIRERAKLAFEGRDVEDGEAPSPPTAVILDIDSRGGVVAGLNECVADLQAMRKTYGIPLIAVLNEMAASAAFALACAADKRYCPASGIVGSIGTISTMFSQAAKDAADGIDVRLITSGASKADGHPHAPISNVAVKAEKGRVDALANAFFRLAGKSLGVSPAKLQALQAAIYLGPDAKKHGLVDDVRSLDQVAASLTRPTPVGGAESKGNETRREAGPRDAAGQRAAAISSQAPQKPLDATRRSASGCRSMKLIARIGMLAALMAGETDPTKRSKLIRLSARKSQALATSAEKGDDDPEDDDDDDEDDEDESKSAKAAKKAEAAKKAAKAAGHRAKAAEFKKKAEEAEEAAQAAEADDDEEAEEAAARGRAGGARASTDATTEILASQAGMATEALARVQALEARAAERDRQATIAKLVAERRVTPGEAKKWASRSAAFWGQVEEMRPKALVAVSEEMLEQPDNTPAADLPAAVRAVVEQGVKASGLTGKAADDLREKSYANHRAALNGAAGSH
jgi:ClpP class serine protease